jgi:hypothetical protein
MLAAEFDTLLISILIFPGISRVLAQFALMFAPAPAAAGYLIDAIDILFWLTALIWPALNSVKYM